jgi:hypothetical protein
MTMDEEKAAAVQQYDVDLTSVKAPVMQPGVPDSVESVAEASTAKADGAGAAAADTRSSGKQTMLYLPTPCTASFSLLHFKQHRVKT